MFEAIGVTDVMLTRGYVGETINTGDRRAGIVADFDPARLRTTPDFHSD
jgi:hypothetical protein